MGLCQVELGLSSLFTKFFAYWMIRGRVGEMIELNHEEFCMNCNSDELRMSLVNSPVLPES